MTYSQKPLIKLFQEGSTTPEKKRPLHIETVISHVFIFDTTVYKFYKNDNDFFNRSFRDLSSKKERFIFTTKDFVWNNALSPSIYTKLIGVTVQDKTTIVGAPDESAEELVIMMNRVDTGNVLFEKLITDHISEEDSFTIGKQLAENLKKVQKELPESNFFDLFESRIKDLRNWIKSVTEYISEEESGMYCDFLENFRIANKDWFESTLSEEVTTDGDFHSHNALFTNNSLYLMDTFPPKDSWGVGHRLLPVYRMGTDMWALSGKQAYFESFLKGYEEGSKLILDRRLDTAYVVYASGIAVSYLYMLQRTDPTKKVAAERFHAFLREYFQRIH